MDRNSANEMEDKNKKRNTEDKNKESKEEKEKTARISKLAKDICDFADEHAKLRENNDDGSIMSSAEKKDKHRRVAIDTRFMAEGIEIAIEKKAVGENVVKDVLKCFFDAFVQSKREMDYKKAEEGFFSFSKKEKTKDLESDNIRRLISRYRHESVGSGYCGYSAILGASGDKRFYEVEYNDFFKVLEEYSGLVNNSVELVIDGGIERWTESAKYEKAICKCITEVHALLGVGWSFENKTRKTAYIRGLIAAVSNWAIKNKDKARSYIGLFDASLTEAVPKMVTASKQLLEGMKGLTEDYSKLLYEGREKYEDSNGKEIINAVEKDFDTVGLGQISSFYPVKINKHDLGVMSNYSPNTDKRYAIRQAFCGHKLIMEVQGNDANRVQLNEISLDFNWLNDKVSTGDISWLPQSDDDLNKTVSIKINRKIYEKNGEGVETLNVKFKKDADYFPPTWIELGCLIGLSKSIGKPFFCLSNNPLNEQGLIVYDASKIREKGNRRHLCKFIFSNAAADLSQMPDEDIEYYSKLASEYMNSISDKNSPVVFFQASDNGRGHYTHLDPKDQKIRKKFEEEIKGMFFDRYIEENKKRQRKQRISWQAKKIGELRKQIEIMKKENEIASKQQNDREQKLNEKEQTLNEQEIRLGEKQNSIEKNTNDLEIKEKDLNKKEQNIQEKENKLQVEEKKLADKERELNERESLQNELEALKKTSEKKVNELNLEVQTLKSKNSEQEKQISILASKNNDQKLAQMQERIREITADNEKNEKEVKDLQNKNEKQGTKLQETEKKVEELESQLKDTKSQKDEFEQKVTQLNSELKDLREKNSEQEKQMSVLNSKNDDEKLKKMTDMVEELTSQLTSQNSEKRDLENRLTSENNQLKEQAKAQEQRLNEYQNEIQKLKGQNEELQKELESTNVLSRSGQLQQEQKETGDVNEKKELHIKLIIEYLENIKVSNTNTILYIFAYMFQRVSSTCKNYIEKASCEKNLVLQFKQLKQNLETNVENIVNDDGQLIEDTLTTLDSFMPKYCDDDMCEKLASLYSELLNLHEHNTKNIIDVFGKISNGEKYIELIKKNSVAKSLELDKTNNISENINLIK